MNTAEARQATKRAKRIGPSKSLEALGGIDSLHTRLPKTLQPIANGVIDTMRAGAEGRHHEPTRVEGGADKLPSPEPEKMFLQCPRMDSRLDLNERTVATLKLRSTAKPMLMPLHVQAVPLGELFGLAHAFGISKRWCKMASMLSVPLEALRATINVLSSGDVMG